MRKLVLATFALAALLITPIGALAQKPPKPGEPTLSISAAPTVVTFGRTTTISGQLSGSPNAGQALELQESPAASSGFKTVATATTNPTGGYSFTVSPKANSKYRVETKSKPGTKSGEVVVRVRIAVALRVSDSTPRRGQRVTFRGTATPAHDGREVVLQRRTTRGYVTVAKATLADAGTERSTYSMRARVSRNGTYRTRVAGDADHVTGTSRPRALRVH